MYLIYSLLEKNRHLYIILHSLINSAFNTRDDSHFITSHSQETHVFTNKSERLYLWARSRLQVAHQLDSNSRLVLAEKRTLLAWPKLIHSPLAPSCRSQHTVP